MEVACSEAGEEGSPRDKSFDSKRQATAQPGPTSSKRRKCPVVRRTDQRRRSARLIIRELNASENPDSSLNVVKSEGKPSRSSKSSCCSFSDLTGSVWRTLELCKEQGSCQESASSSIHRSPTRKDRSRKRRRCSQSLEEAPSQRPQNRKRKKFSDSRSPLEESFLPGQAAESTTDCREHWTRSKDKEQPGPEPIDSHSPGSCQTGLAHSREGKKRREQPAEALRVVADHRSRHRGRGHRHTSSDEHSPLQKLSTHRRRKSSSSKGKGRKGKERLDLSQEQIGRQKAIRKSVIKYAMSSPPKSSHAGPSGLQGEPQADSGSSGAESVDPFMALMNEENRRLQMMLESRGLPPHLLGSLGPRIPHPHMFHKSVSSTNNSRAHQLLEGLRAAGDESTQLQSCIEMGQLLLMGNEDTLSGFPVKETVPALVELLTMEHNFDMMLNSCRALTYMMEALPRSSVVVAEAIPVLLEKLQVIQCMDVAEQALSALDILSRKHSKSILQAGGVNSCMLYLDFFSLATQRSALSVAANCCLSVSEDDFPLVADSIPVLSGRLQHQDKKSVESCCLCFSRLVENFWGSPKILMEIASHQLLPNLQNLLVVSPPVISANMVVTVVRMMSSLCSSCPSLAVQLLQLNIEDTLRYLLAGSDEITLEDVEFNSRTPSEVYEIVSLISELMPPLPKDGIFEVDQFLTSTRPRGPSLAKWEWQDDNQTWKPYGRVESRLIEAAHMTNESEITVDINGRTYIIDFSSMQQINEETGKNRQIRRTLSSLADSADQQAKSKDKEKDEDARATALLSDPQLCLQLMQALFAVLYEVFSNMAGSMVKHKCLKALLKMFHCATPVVLIEVLRDVSVSCYISTMLGSQDYRVVVAGIQMAVILIEKLPEVFLVYFQREGVVHAMEALKTIPLKALTTPKKPEEARSASSMILPLSQSEGEVSSSSSAETPLTPNTAKRRIVDIIRKSHRHLRRSFSRARSEDELSVGRDPASMPPLLPPFSAVPLPSMVMGAPGVSSAVHSRLLSSLDSRLACVGVIESNEKEKQGNKEKIKEWIQEQASCFLKKWTVESSAISQQHPELNVIKMLQGVASQLDPTNSACLEALKGLCAIVSNSTYNVSAFELLYCHIPDKLNKMLTEEGSHCYTTQSMRLRHFVHLFMGLPEYECDLATWLPTEQSALSILVQKLHGCINQTEQFIVRVHDLPGRRGSQAMNFFNSHQLKCNLERHPSATGLQQWKGGIVRVDPLATMQAIERYLLIRGVTHPEPEKKLEDMEGSEDSEPDEAMLSGIQHILGPMKHQLELLIGGHVVPPNTTVFQAIRQFGNMGGIEAEDDIIMMGHPFMWTHPHTIQYRLLEPEHSSVRPKRSFSLPSPPLEGPSVPSRRGIPGSAGHNGRNRRAAAAVPTRVSSSGSYSTPPGPVRRVTRSTSKETILRQTRHHHLRQHKGQKEEQGLAQSPIPSDTSTTKLSPLFEDIQNCKNHKFGLDDPSVPMMRLLKILWSLNSHWNDLYNGFPGNPILSTSDFVNSKLSAKSFRQLQDPLNVMTGSFPDWLKNLTRHCSFMFPFECRQLLFYLTAFDRDRALYRLQEPDFAPGDSSDRAIPKLDKKKRCVSRELLLEQAEKIMEELAGSKALLEVQYQDEVGTGLGPTLEFYTLVSRELQRVDLHMWRGDPCPLPGSSQASSSDTVTEFIHSPVGLFPAPLGVETSFGVLEEVCGRFRFLGRFIAKAIIDSRMLDIPLSEAFYKWMLGKEKTFTAQDLQHVDPIIARSYAQLAAVAVKKHRLESDPLLSGKALQHGVEALSLEGGGSVEDLELDFTLPGYPDIELKPHGKEIGVTIHNLDEYLRLVLDWTLETGVSRQMEAFREGFNSVFPISSLQMFYSHEMDMLLCGANHQKWDIKELVENCHPDHGYTHDSQAVQLLFRVLSSYDTSEQRQFIQFVTGSPRLPVGGFKALNPPLTIVRKTVDSSQNPDRFLPSVMTCVNYLKLPDYSSEEVMREKLSLALQEGKDSFHLS